MADDRIASLEAEVRELRALLESKVDRAEVPSADEPVSRRAALRTAGVLAAGAIAGGVGMVASASPAAATTAGPYTATSSDPALTVQAANGKSAILATSSSSAATIDATGAPAVKATGQFGGNGVEASGSYGVVTIGSSAGILAQGYYAAFGDSASAGGDFAGNPAVSAFGVYNSVSGFGGYAIAAEGQNGAILLTSTQGPPNGRVLRAVSSGVLDVDTNGDLWFSVAAGLPGTWRKIAGSTTAGAFHAIAPMRAYDSRKSAYSEHGVIANGTTRLVSVADSHNVADGALLVSEVVPAGATAIAANVTVTGTTGTGYFCINPGGTTTLGASTINWFGAGQTLANGVVLAVNDNRKVTIVAGNAAGSAHCIIDVTGYWL